MVVSALGDVPVAKGLVELGGHEHAMKPFALGLLYVVRATRTTTISHEEPDVLTFATVASTTLRAAWLVGVRL
jgi:hypothetical protein